MSRRMTEADYRQIGDLYTLYPERPLDELDLAYRLFVVNGVDKDKIFRHLNYLCKNYNESSGTFTKFVVRYLKRGMI